MLSYCSPTSDSSHVQVKQDANSYDITLNESKFPNLVHGRWCIGFRLDQ